MLALVPAVIMITLTLVMAFNAYQAGETVNPVPIIVDEMVRVHEWRVDRADRDDLEEPFSEELPGYPFNDPLLDYVTATFRKDDLRIMMTYPAEYEAPVSRRTYRGYTIPNGKISDEIVIGLRDHPDREVRAGRYITVDGGESGEVDNVDVPFLSMPGPGWPVLLDIKGIPNHDEEN